MSDARADAEQPEPAAWPRRMFLQAGAAGLVACSVLASHTSSARAAPGRKGPSSRTFAFDTGWLFGEFSAGSNRPDFDDSDLQTVTLPHTVTRLSWRRWDPAGWERVWIYRKHFDVPAGIDGMRVFLDFDGAMTQASPTLNGHDLPDHLGGYLPFRREITGLLTPRGNVLAVRVDSRFHLNVPPNHPARDPASSVDFWQPGGLYRQVRLRAVPQVFLADVFAKPVDVLDVSARRIEVSCTVDAAVVPRGAARIVVRLYDGERTLASASAPVTITRPGQVRTTVTLTDLSALTLWELDDPTLYTVVATVLIDDDTVHDHRTRTGLREARFEQDGFFLNGRRTPLIGLNRHQLYPYAGGAMPDRVQRKDAEILRRELNCTMVRCSHYPQAEAFLDACDELGLLAWQEAPGWQYLGDQAWKDLARRDVGEMIRRDRNHPSVIVWGARLNETPDDVALYTRTRDLAHSLDDSRPTVGAMIGGMHDTTHYVQDVFAYNDYASSTDRDGHRQPELLPPRTDRPYLVSETVGTLSGPARYYRRTDPQEVQQGQAGAYARVLDIAASDERYCGLLGWSGYDYESGSGNQFEGVKYTGVIDAFRVPKPGAAIYASQVDPRIRPVIQPAFYWDFGPTSPVTGLDTAMICANLDRLEVYVGGAHHATVAPDATGHPHLRHPPSFVDFTTVDGAARPELRIDGYLDGAKVASRSFSGDPAGDVLSLDVDDTELVADGVDATRVVFRAVDAHGAPRPYVQGRVELSVSGPAVLVGDNPFEFGDTGGVGAVWLRTLPHSPGTVTLTATHPTLGSTRATVHVRQSTPAGPPAPYGALSLRAAPALVTPTAATTLTGTFTNHGSPDLDRVTLTVRAPDGWRVTTTEPTTFSDVASGRSVRSAWRVDVPADAAPGRAPCVVHAVYTAGRQRGVTERDTALLVPYSSLSEAFDNIGITDDGDVGAGDLDGVGNSYSAQALAAAGLVPGGTFTHRGVSFVWPDTPAGRPDNVLADGQTVALSGSGSVLGFLGAGSRGNNGGPGTVHYSDGSTNDFQVTLGDYFFPAPAGNDSVAVMHYLNTATGRGNNGVPGQRQHDVYVFAAAVPVTVGKQIVAVTLPRVSGTVDGGGPAMHLFAIGIG